MTRSILLLTTIGIAVLLVTPARLYAQQSLEPAGHADHQAAAAASAQAPEHDRMPSPSTEPDIDTLVAKVNAATGAAKIDAVAEVLAALVQKHKDCEAKMAGMMGNMGSHGEKAADPHAAH